MAKMCECGCGRPTKLSRANFGGYVIGQPRRFLSGHSTRVLIQRGKENRHGYTQSELGRRNDEIAALVRSTLTATPMPLGDLAPIVQRQWPEVSTWGVSRITTRAFFWEDSIQPNFRLSKYLLPKHKAGPRVEVLAPSAALAFSVQRDSADDLTSRAFALAQRLSYEKSAELIGPIWEGMHAAWACGMRDTASLEAAAMNSLRAHRRQLSDYAVRSLDMMREAWDYEPPALSLGVSA